MEAFHHFYSVEAAFAPGHHRGIDLFTPVWNLFDPLPEGREMWMPRHFYNAASSAGRSGI